MISDHRNYHITQIGWLIVFTVRATVTDQHQITNIIRLLDITSCDPDCTSEIYVWLSTTILFIELLKGKNLSACLEAVKVDEHKNAIEEILKFDIFHRWNKRGALFNSLRGAAKDKRQKRCSTGDAFTWQLAARVPKTPVRRREHVLEL